MVISASIGGIGALIPYYMIIGKFFMNGQILPIERHFELIKGIGIPCVGGMATINGALAFASISGKIPCNYVSFVLFAVEAVAPIVAGINIFDIFIKYYNFDK